MLEKILRSVHKKRDEFMKSYANEETKVLRESEELNDKMYDNAYFLSKIKTLISIENKRILNTPMKESRYYH